MSLYDPVDKLKVNVDRVICGSLMTSLEMAGVSLTLLQLDPDWGQYIGQCACDEGVHDHCWNCFA